MSLFINLNISGKDKNMKVKESKDLGLLFTDNSHKMIGQDGAFSVPLKNKTLWFFGDTLIGKREPNKSLWFKNGKLIGPEDMSEKDGIEKMMNNSGLLAPIQTGENGLSDYEYICNNDGSLKILLPLTDNENKDKVRIWCQHGIYLNNKIYLSFIKVKMLESGFLHKNKSENDFLPVNFEVVGSGLAVGFEKDWKFKRINHSGENILWGKDVPHFGSSIYYNNRDEYLYFYGAKKDKNGEQVCHVARVKSDEIENYAKYEYLIDLQPKWSKDINRSIGIIEKVPSEISVSFNKYLNKYLAIHSFGLSGKVVARTSDTPWGIWSEPITLWTESLEHKMSIPYPKLIYAGKEHPELSAKNGKIIYITYIEFEEYFPRMIKVTLENN